MVTAVPGTATAAGLPPPSGPDWPAQFAAQPGLALEEIMRPLGVGQTLTFIDPDGRRESVSYDMFARRLGGAARQLQAQGVRPGSLVAAMLSTSLPSVIRALAVWVAGATLVSVPPPPRRAMRDQHLARLGEVLAAMPCELMISEKDGQAIAGTRAIPAASLDGLDAAPPDADIPDVALIQFTSGSLGSPKGVAIGSATLAGHLNMITRCMGCDPASDAMATWLPFYHDFGLICFFLTGVCARIRQVHMHPRAFAADPSSWLRLLSAERATITGAPHFGFRLAGRVPYPGNLDLSGVRVALNGGERVHWDDLEDFQKAAEPAGFPWEAQLPVYGLAENTVGATCTMRQRSGPVRGPGGLVSSGQNLPGTELACAGLPDSPAELRVSGRWLYDGYYTAAGFQSRGDADLATGDVGFLSGGHAYVLGRDSEVISAGGRNLFAEDVEVTASQAGKPQVRGCAAFKPEPASQRFGMWVEASVRDAPEGAALARDIRSAVSAELGTRVEPLLVVVPGTIPRTTSGKVQRARCRATQAAGDLPGRKVIAEIS